MSHACKKDARRDHRGGHCSRIQSARLVVLYIGLPFAAPDKVRAKAIPIEACGELGAVHHEGCDCQCEISNRGPGKRAILLTLRVTELHCLDIVSHDGVPYAAQAYGRAAHLNTDFDAVLTLLQSLDYGT